jgi:SAM-dependent methyltransferase
MTTPPPTRADTDPIPPPRVSEREAREAALDPAVLTWAARSAHAARLEVLENLREDPDRVNAFRAAVACAVTHDGARRVVVLDAGCTGGALAVEAARAGAEQVVAFEPDPTLATLVRETASRVLPPADLRRLAVLETDAARVEACDGDGAAWCVRAHDLPSVGGLSGARAEEPHEPDELFSRAPSFVATEKADCLVLGAFAVADAVGMAARADALAELRDSGVFDALLRTTTDLPRDDRDGVVLGGSRISVIPRRTRLFAQAVAGSNLNDARALRRIDARLLFSSPGILSTFESKKRKRKSGDVFRDSPPLAGGLCPAAAQMRVRARFREDTVTRVSDVFEMTKIPDASIERRNRHDWVPEPRGPSALRFLETRVPKLAGDDQRTTLAMSWWWMDVGARWMDGGDGNEGMRDVVVLSSAPGDAASAKEIDRTVTFTFKKTSFPITASFPFPIAFRKGSASDSESEACSCGAHAVWGLDGVARWNDSETARRLASGIVEVTRRAGADRGALLDLSDGPRMSVLAASFLSFSFEANETNARFFRGDDDVSAEFSETEREFPKTTQKRNTVLCVERDAGSARFSRGVARASGFDSDTIKVAALDPGGDAEGCFFFSSGNASDDERRVPGDDGEEALPVLEPANAIDCETHMDKEPKQTTPVTGPEQNIEHNEHTIDAHTVTVRVGAGAEARDARLAEARADADVSAADASAAYRRSRAKADAICAKLAATRDAYRAAVLAAMADVRLPTATHETSRLEGDDFVVAFEAGYDPRPEDDFLFAAYCEWRNASRALESNAESARHDRSDARVTAKLERLGLGGVDFEEVEADPRVARAAAVWLALAEAFAEAEEAAAADLTRAQEARKRALAAAGQHAATLRGAAESALGKTPAWVFLCDPFSFVSFGPKSRELSGALRWGDGALAETLRRRLWARRAGILYVNHLSVPREAVIAVAAVSCPGLRARFEPELKGALERAFSKEESSRVDANDANEDEDASSSAAIALRERLARAFAAPSPNVRGDANEEFREESTMRFPASNDGPFGPFVPPTPTYLDDVAHAVVSRPTVAARVDLAGDGYDRARFAWGGGGDAVVEVSGSSLASPRGDDSNDDSNAATVVDALVFWTEFDVGDGGPRLSTGPASVGSPNDKARRLLARDAQGVFFLDSPLRLSEARSARFFVETRLELETENASLRGGGVGHVEARVRTTVTRGEPSGRAS